MRLWLAVVLGMPAGAQTVPLEHREPGWWSDPATAIWEVDRVNFGNGQVVTVGQLKHVASRARDYFNLILGPFGGAGPAIEEAVGSFTGGVYAPPSDKAVNYSGANVGQLKFLGDLFYARLHELNIDAAAGVASRLGGTVSVRAGKGYKVPWAAGSPAQENSSAALVGQLKMVFGFELDSDDDGLLDAYELFLVSLSPSDGLASLADIRGPADARLEAEYEAGVTNRQAFQQTRNWIAWQPLTEPRISLMTLPASGMVTPGAAFAAHAQFNLGSYRPGYWNTDPVPAARPWPWAEEKSGNYDAAHAVTVTAQYAGQLVRVTAKGSYPWPPDRREGEQRYIPAGFQSWAAVPLTPQGADTDADGLPDDWEQHWRQNLSDLSSAGDKDGDGLTDLREYHWGTNPGKADTDRDRLPDLIEVLRGLNPQDSQDIANDSDNDGLSDGLEVAVLHEAARLMSGGQLAPGDKALATVDPWSARDIYNRGIFDDWAAVFGLVNAGADSDSDNDGLQDGTECLLRTWPAAPVSLLMAFPDHDQDGVADIFSPEFDFAVSGYSLTEVQGTAFFLMPSSEDTDGDGLEDGDEYSVQRNPRVWDNYSAQGSAAAIPGFWQGAGYFTDVPGIFHWPRFGNGSNGTVFSSPDFSREAPANPHFEPVLQLRYLVSYFNMEDQIWDDWKRENEIAENQTFRYFPEAASQRSVTWIDESREINYRSSGGHRTRVTNGVSSRPKFGYHMRELLYQPKGQAVRTQRRYRALSGPAGNLSECPVPEDPPWDSGFFPKLPSKAPGSDLDVYYNQAQGFNRWKHAGSMYFGRNAPADGADWVSDKVYAGIENNAVEQFVLHFTDINGMILPQYDGVSSDAGRVTFYFPQHLEVHAAVPEIDGFGHPQRRRLKAGVAYPLHIFKEGLSTFINVEIPEAVPGRVSEIYYITDIPDFVFDTAASPPLQQDGHTILEGPAIRIYEESALPDSTGAITLAVEEESGSRFRKIGLNGLPVADGKPQSEEETDTREDTTHVDALNLRLTHQTSDVYVPIAGADLALSVERTMTEEIFSSQVVDLQPNNNAVAPGTAFIGQPFGVGWRSNLTPHVMLDIDLENPGSDPVVATVVDETGGTLRFAMLANTGGSGVPAFLPLSGAGDGTALMNSLSITSQGTAAPDGSNAYGATGWGLELKKRFGTRVRFQHAGSLAYSTASGSGRIRVYYRPVSGSLESDWAVEDRMGQRLYYTYAHGVSAGVSIGRKLLPATVRDSFSAKRLIQIEALTENWAGISDAGKFIRSVTLMDTRNSQMVAVQKVTYDYQVRNLSSSIGTDVAGGAFHAVCLETVRRGTLNPAAFAGTGTEYQYAAAADSDPNPVGSSPPVHVHHGHVWVDRITDGLGNYYRFDTAFDRSRLSYKTLADTPVTDYGLPRTVTAVYRGAIAGGERVQAEFGLQQDGTGPDLPLVLKHLDAASPAGPAAVTGRRVNAVIDADRRIRYYRFSDPDVRDNKFLENHFKRRMGSGGWKSVDRVVLLNWKRMEIDHGLGATEVYTFRPDAMMALASAEITIPATSGAGAATTSRTDWEYGDRFYASQLVPLLAGGQSPGGPAFELNPFFPQYYPDPTRETRILSGTGPEHHSQFPAEGETLIKTFKYWSSTSTAADRYTRPWSRIMVESTVGPSPTSLVSKTVTTLNAQGLPAITEEYGTTDTRQPGAAGTLLKRTRHYYGYTPSTSLFAASPSTAASTGAHKFRVWRTDVEKGAGTGLGGLPLRNLISVTVPDDYGYASWTATGDATTHTARHTKWNAAGQKLAEADGRATGPEQAEYATTYQYRADGRLESITYPAQPASSRFPATTPTEETVKTFGYDGAGRKTRETEANGLTTGYEYDFLGRVILKGVRRTGDSSPYQTTAWEYTGTGLPIRETAPNGLVTEYQYDWLRRPVRTATRDTAPNAEHPVLVTEMEYGLNSGDSLFSTSSFKPTLIRGPHRLPQGPAASRKMAYDSLGRLVREEVEYAAGSFATTSYGYDALGSRILVQDPSGQYTLSLFNGLGQSLITQTPDGGTVHTAWTPAGLAEESKVYIPAVAGLSSIPAQTRTTRTAYDAAGRVYRTYLPSSANGGVVSAPSTETLYDAAGNATSASVRSSVNSPAGGGLVTTLTQYDTRGRVWKVTRPAVPVAGSPTPVFPVTTTWYDSMNRPTVVKDPLGATTLTVYDQLGRVIRTVGPPVPVYDGDPAAMATRRLCTLTEYDVAGNAVRVLTGKALDQTGEAAAYAAAVAWTSDGSASADEPGETLNLWNQRGRLIRTLTSTSAAPADTISQYFQYDEAGNRTRVTDGSGQRTLFTYDGLGRLLSTSTGPGEMIRHFHNQAVKTHTVDAGNRVTRYAYDDRLRVREISFSHPGPGDGKQNFLYNSAGELLQSTVENQSHLTAEYRYDHRGRLVQETSAGLSHLHLYDEPGNRIQTQYGGSPRKISTWYDDLNRSTRIVDTFDFDYFDEVETVFHYDLAGRAVRKTLPNGTREEKTFDAAGRVVTATILYKGPAPNDPDITESTTSSGYDRFARLAWQREQRRAFGALPAVDRVIINEYDWVHRLLVERITAGGATTETRYSYDKGGNRISLQKAAGSGSGATVTFSEKYYYGGTDAEDLALKETWRTVAGQTATVSYQANQLRKITRVTGSGPGATEKVTDLFRYDKTGNRVQHFKVDDTVTRTQEQADKGEDRQYQWDRLGRLLSVVRSGRGGAAPAAAETWTYGYDHRTRRVHRQAPGSSGAGEIDSFSGGLAISRWNTPGLASAWDQRSLQYETIRGSDMGGGVGGVLYTIAGPPSGSPYDPSGPRSFYEYGARGDVIGHSNAAGTSVFRAQYQAFGSHTDHGTAGPGGHRASTKEEESALGLLNEGFRWRDIRTGAFLSRDPAGFIDGPNLYAYVLQNPWSSFDALGLEVTRADILALGLKYATHEYDDPADKTFMIPTSVKWRNEELMRQNQALVAADAYKSQQEFAKGVMVVGGAVSAGVVFYGGMAVAPALVTSAGGPAAVGKEVGSEVFEEVTGVPIDMVDLLQSGIKKLAKEGGEELLEESAKKIAAKTPDPWLRTPKTLQDQMTLEAAQKGAGVKIIDNLNDPRFKGMEKWEYKVKSSNRLDSVVHYVRDPATGDLMDFKFKKSSSDGMGKWQSTPDPKFDPGDPQPGR